MPWVSETTTSFSAFIAAATAPAAVSALTLRRPPALSRAIVAMQGIESACTSSCSSRAFTLVTSPTSPRSMRRPSGPWRNVFSANSTLLDSECSPIASQPWLWMKFTMNLFTWLHSTCSAIARVRSSV